MNIYIPTPAIEELSFRIYSTMILVFLLFVRPVKLLSIDMSFTNNVHDEFIIRGKKPHFVSKSFDELKIYKETVKSLSVNTQMIYDFFGSTLISEIKASGRNWR